MSLTWIEPRFPPCSPLAGDLETQCAQKSQRDVAVVPPQFLALPGGVHEVVQWLRSQGHVEAPRALTRQCSADSQDPRFSTLSSTRMDPLNNSLLPSSPLPPPPLSAFADVVPAFRVDDAEP